MRLRYRYLDLRREHMQRNLRLRAVVNGAIRRAMDAQGFCEVETPLLWAPTPEGSREFVVPSRLQPGEFYVLPQSPQIAKQLLMVGGFDRYYQIARCMRDEDLRADRQFEFTQLDMEASFVDQDDVLGFVSLAVLDAAEAATGVRPEAIPSMTWTEALDRYGTDKPDLRFAMVLHDLSDVFATTEVKAFSAPTVKAMRVPGGASFSRARLDELTDQAKALGAKGLAWFRITDDGLDSPLAKFLNETESAAIAYGRRRRGRRHRLLRRRRVRRGLSRARRHPLDAGLAARRRGSASIRVGHRVPALRGRRRGRQPPGGPPPLHDAASRRHGPDRDRPAEGALAAPTTSSSTAGNSGSGSVRIHRADIQSRVFRALGISEEEAESRFGFLLGAFKYGAPPHAGFAFGIDRLVAIFAGEENIREVIAYPKTQSGADLMTGAPKGVAPKVMRELRINITPKGS